MVKQWTFEDGKRITHLNENSCSLNNDGISLRSRDPLTGLFSRSPNYQAGEFELPNWETDALTELYGLDVDWFPADGNIEFAASNDGGATYLYHDGGGWVPGALFNSWQDFDENIDTFPFSTVKKQIRMKVKLSPDASNTQRPILRGLRLFCNFKFKMSDDVLRTFKHFIENRVTILNEEEQEAAAVSFLDLLTTTEVINDNQILVYNETTDPGHTINLYDSYELFDLGSGNFAQRVHFNASQTGHINIKYNCKVPVHISTSEEFQSSDNPAFVLEMEELPEDRHCKNFAYEWSYKFKLKKGYRRRMPSWYSCSLRITAFSSLKRLANVMGNAIDDIFVLGGIPTGESTDVVPSEATGFDLPVISFTGMSIQDQVSQGVYVSVGDLMIKSLEWKGGEEEVSLVEEALTHIGTQDVSFITLKSVPTSDGIYIPDP